MAIYFIIGAIILTFTTLSQVAKRRDYMLKCAFKQPSFWFATVLCAILWPILILWAWYDTIQFKKTMGDL